MTAIANLLETTEYTPSDVLVISDGVLTRKITVNNFKQALLNKATRTIPGIVRVGAGLDITETGVLSVKNFSAYELPPATTSSLGGVVVGPGLSIDSHGILRTTYVLPQASFETLGGVRIGQGLLIDPDGLVSVDSRDRNKFPSGAFFGSNSQLKIDSFIDQSTLTTTLGALQLIVTDSQLPNKKVGLQVVSSKESRDLAGPDSPAIVTIDNSFTTNLGLPGSRFGTVFANTLNGTLEGNVVGNVVGNLTGNLVATNGVIAFDASNSVFSGSFTGPLIGNASSASRLFTPRSINGVFFDGTNDIVVEDATKLPRTGGSMNGFLSLHATPAAPMHATPKQYVDSIAAGKVSINGDTMTGFLTLSHTPNNPMHATPKQYVDSEILTRLPLSGGTMAGHISQPLLPTALSHLTNQRYVNTTIDSKILENNVVLMAHIDAQDALRLRLTGGTMTGPIVLSGNPTSNLHASPKQYVDSLDSAQRLFTQTRLLEEREITNTALSQKVSKSGDTMTGKLTVPAAGIDFSNIATTSASPSVFSIKINGTDSSLNVEATSTNAITINNKKVWTELNHGHLSGLDADLLDGLHASAFVLKSELPQQQIYWAGVTSVDNAKATYANYPIGTIIVVRVDTPGYSYSWGNGTSWVAATSVARAFIKVATNNKWAEFASFTF